MSITRWSLQSKSEVQELLEAQPRTTLASWVLSNLPKRIWTAESMYQFFWSMVGTMLSFERKYFIWFISNCSWKFTSLRKLSIENSLLWIKEAACQFFSSMLTSHGANYTVKMCTCLVFTLFSFSCLCKALTMDGIWVVRRFTGLQRAKK